MKIYLASRYSRREELAGYAKRLEETGHHVVTARWLQGLHEADERTAAIELRQRFAYEDLADLDEADVLVAFTEEPYKIATRGGRHVELGYALAKGKLVVIVGPVENVFCSLALQYDSFDELLAAMTIERYFNRTLVDIASWMQDVRGSGETGCDPQVVE
jgi:nucleoside 2-deoxyribosyltransferase